MNGPRDRVGLEMGREPSAPYTKKQSQLHVGHCQCPCGLGVWVGGHPRLHSTYFGYGYNCIYLYWIREFVSAWLSGLWGVGKKQFKTLIGYSSSRDSCLNIYKIQRMYFTTKMKKGFLFIYFKYCQFCICKAIKPFYQDLFIICSCEIKFTFHFLGGIK